MRRTVRRFRAAVLRAAVLRATVLLRAVLRPTVLLPTVVLPTALLLAGCGVPPAGPADGGKAPTGVANGPALYFVGPGGGLRADQRGAGQLGTIAEAMSLLLVGPGPASPLRTEIAPTEMTRVPVSTTPSLIRIRLPLTVDDVTPVGIDQIVCTALAVHVQSGGSADTKVQVRFTLTTPESDKMRTCPMID